VVAAGGPAPPGGIVDVTELVLLLDRHEQRAPLTALIVARSGDPETRELARRVQADATEADVEATELLERWGQSGLRTTPPSPRLAGADTASVLTGLQGRSSDDFDRAALGVLLQELQGDIVNGAIARNDGRDDDARRLGDETVTRAQQRIEKLTSILARLEQ
jgi:uncharacterized protein (DUF305 family)